MASPVSFAGLSTNLPTDKLVQAIMDQESQPLVRMQDKQALGTQKISALRSVSSGLLALNTTLSSLASSSFLSRTVASSDSTGTYVSATGSGAATGTYDVKVGQLATKARLISSGGLASATGTVGAGTYELKAMDGSTKSFTMDAGDTLQTFRDKINSLGAGVTASIINTGIGATPYQLVVTASDTGTGSSGATTFGLSQTSGTNSLGLYTGSVADAGAQSGAAQNAQFWVNGIAMERKTNIVTDAVDGMTFTLKAGGQTVGSTATTFTVTTDKSAITNALNDVVAKFNAVLKTIKDNSASGKPLSGELNIRNLLETQRSSLTGSAGTAGTYNSGAEIGLKTNRDGTLSLDSTVFQAALDKDPTAVQNVFTAISAKVSTSVLAITSPGSGDLAKVIQGVDAQNARLSLQISSTQSRLDKRREALMAQFSALETTIGRMQSAGQSLAGLA